MVDYKELVAYDNLFTEVNVVSKILNSINLSDTEKIEAIFQWISNKNFDIIGLYAKAPRYASGKEVYQEYYSSVSPLGKHKGLAVKENFEDVVNERELILPIQFVDSNNNTIILGGDFTDEIKINQSHEIIQSFTGDTILASGDVIAASYVSGTDITMVTFQSIDLTNVNVGNFTKFVNGGRLSGIRHKIEWFSKTGEVLITKSFSSNFEKFEASIHEYNRRQNTVNQLISSADGTAIQPFVKTVYTHYQYPHVVNYIDLGDAQGWKDAIDAEQDPKINSYLDIMIPFTNIENETVYKKIRDYIKDELYVGYK